MHSLFEEQIVGEEVAINRAMELGNESYGEALSYLPEAYGFALGPDEYLEQIRRLKHAVRIPVIASLNGTTEGGWLRYAHLIEQAGADGLELNIYELGADPKETAAQIEQRMLSIVASVKRSVAIPIAVKLSPFYTSLANLAWRLDDLGVDGLVLFNRFFQPDIDPEQLDIVRVNLSSPSDLLLRLRWIGALFGRVYISLACSGGVHASLDAVKAVMAGAHAVQMVSALLQRGPEYLREVRDDLARFLEEHGFDSLRQMQGSMSLLHCPEPKLWERANYVKILQTWQV
jgi:dihydroorotate dehydrogenase (fumarate)